MRCYRTVLHQVNVYYLALFFEFGQKIRYKRTAVFGTAFGNLETLYFVYWNVL